MVYTTKDISDLTGLSRQRLAELNELKIIEPSSYRNNKKYKLYDEKQLDDLCIIAVMLKCNKTPSEIKGLIAQNKTKNLYDILDIIRTEAEDIVKVITNIQIVGPEVLTKSFNSIGRTSLHDIAERYRTYEKNLEDGTEHIVNQNSKNEEYFEDIFEKKFKSAINGFVKAKKTRNKQDVKTAIKDMLKFFKVISNNNPVQYLISEAYALQGGGFESDYVNSLAGTNISNYISETILNEYIPKLEKEIAGCFREIDINKNKYTDKEVQLATKKMIECFEKYILFDDLTQKGNQIVNMIKMLGIREQNLSNADEFLLKALEFYNNQKKGEKNG